MKRQSQRNSKKKHVLHVSRTLEQENRICKTIIPLPRPLNIKRIAVFCLYERYNPDALSDPQSCY